jgi:hypothetical protein
MPAVVAGGLVITIAGASTGPGTPQSILVESLSINDRLNEDPNTLTATVRGTKPHEGDEILVTLPPVASAPVTPAAGLGYLGGMYLGSYAVGSPAAAPAPRLFAGIILRTTQIFAANNPLHSLWHVEATDYTWLLEATIHSGHYTTESASAIAADILTRYAPVGFRGDIQAGLPVLDELTFTNSTVIDALHQVANRIGGIVYCDYDKVIHVASADAQIGVPPDTLTLDHPSLAQLSYVRDLTQVVTRAIVEGGGGTAPGEIPAGSPQLPVSDLSWYSQSGGFVRAGPQRIRYTGIAAGGAGAQVGTGALPTSAPTAIIAQGASNNPAGVHQYAYTWATGTGETVPSPLLTVRVGAGPQATPGISPPAYDTPGSSLTVGRTYEYALAWVYGASGFSEVGPIGSSGFGTCITLSGRPSAFYFGRNYYTGAVDSSARVLAVYRKHPNGSWYLVGSMVAGIPPAAGTWFTEGRADSDLGNVNTPPHPDYIAGSVNFSRVTLTNIPPGPSGTTSRKIYRTTAGGAQLKLLTTIANNSATAMSSYDDVADGSLGANAPTSDTSGLVAKTDLVPAGSSTIPVTSVAPFDVNGGYVIIGNQVIRYTGLTSTAITGIPPVPQPGSLQQSVPWGTTISAAPALTGIPATGAGAMTTPIPRGTDVNIVVILDDEPAQAALAAVLGGTGVREGLLKDGRIGLEEAASRGQALLKAHSTVLETLAHRSRDVKTRSGSLITVDLAAPADIHGIFRIQDVQIGPFNARGLVFPTIDARSATSRTTFEDFLRTLADTAPPPATGETS